MRVLTSLQSLHMKLRHLLCDFLPIYLLIILYSRYTGTRRDMIGIEKNTTRLITRRFGIYFSSFTV